MEPAIINGDFNQVYSLINNGININLHTAHKLDTPLTLSIKYNRENIFDLLLNSGANVQLQIHDGLTPLMVAISFKRYSMIIKLLSITNPDTINITDSKRNTALFYAILTYFPEREEIIKLIIEKGANIENINIYGLTPIHLAAMEDLLDIFIYLLQIGAHYNHIDYNGNNIIHNSCRSTTGNILYFILNSNLPENMIKNYVISRNKNGNTPLHIAAINYDGSKQINLLLSKYRNILINMQNNKGDTALHLALSKNNIDSVEEMLKFIPDTSIKNYKGISANDMINKTSQRYV